MSASDLAALEFGRMWMRAVEAEARAAALAQQLAETKAHLAEFTNGVETPAKPARKRAAKVES